MFFRVYPQLSYCLLYTRQMSSCPPAGPLSSTAHTLYFQTSTFISILTAEAKSHWGPVPISTCKQRWLLFQKLQGTFGGHLDVLNFWDICQIGVFEHSPGHESSSPNPTCAAFSWRCDFHEGNDDQNNLFHTTSWDVLESECPEIESVTSNKAAKQKPQETVKLSISNTTTIYREESVHVGWKDMNLLERS